MTNDKTLDDIYKEYEKVANDADSYIHNTPSGRAKSGYADELKQIKQIKKEEEKHIKELFALRQKNLTEEKNARQSLYSKELSFLKVVFY